MSLSNVRSNGRVVVVFCLSFLFTAPSLSAGPVVPSNLPPEYGKVIYRLNETSPNQLYIIGMSHRDALTGSKRSNTVKVQAEVYRLGDWLIHHAGLELLLPEGYMEDNSGRRVVNLVRNNTEAGCAPLRDIKTLENILSDTSTFINAEKLLKRYHALSMRQVEDPQLYNSVRDALYKLVNGKSDSCDVAALRSEVDYWEDRRTAAILQKIPGIIDHEFEEGDIHRKQAILTIGMFHLHTIMDYLNQHQIDIQPPPEYSKEGRYTAELNLLKENFGVTILLPRELLNDQRVLELNKLDKGLSVSR